MREAKGKITLGIAIPDLWRVWLRKRIPACIFWKRHMFLMT